MKYTLVAGIQTLAVKQISGILNHLLNFKEMHHIFVAKNCISKRTDVFAVKDNGKEVFTYILAAMHKNLFEIHLKDMIYAVSFLL